MKVEQVNQRLGGQDKTMKRCICQCCCPHCAFCQFVRAVKVAKEKGLLTKQGAPQEETMEK